MNYRIVPTTELQKLSKWRIFTTKFNYQEGSMKQVIWIAFWMLMMLPSAQAANVIQIAVDNFGFSFLLDDEGHVWAFKDPLNFADPIRLPNLEHITKIAPYIAVDTEGQVFTWNTNKIESNEGEINYVEYTTPTKVRDLKNVTLVASSLRHFVVAIENRDIVEWTASPIESQDEGLGLGKDGTFRNVYSKNGIKQIAPFTGGITKRIDDKHLVTTHTYAFTVLFEDGETIDFGVTKPGKISAGGNMQSVLLTTSPGALGLARNNGHTVIISADGKLHFWGMCGAYDAGGDIEDVTSMALNRNENDSPDMFIKRDGTAWLSYAPKLSLVPNDPCGKITRNARPRRTVQVQAGNSPAVQVASGGNINEMLDANHNLWQTNHNWQKEMYKVNLDLK